MNGTFPGWKSIVRRSVIRAFGNPYNLGIESTCAGRISSAALRFNMENVVLDGLGKHCVRRLANIGHSDSDTHPHERLMKLFLHNVNNPKEG